MKSVLVGEDLGRNSGAPFGDEYAQFVEKSLESERGSLAQGGIAYQLVDDDEARKSQAQRS